MNSIEFHELYRMHNYALIDVRTPAEYAAAHIPGALNVPLFSDEERAMVGSRYHNAGKEAGFLLGLELVGPHLAGFVKKLHALVPASKSLVLYCWRGGMRSHAMGWLFEQAGYKISIVKGGYKAYRAYIREALCSDWDYRIIGGLSGSGKTEILALLKESGAQVIDLEALACHKGSVFGHLGQPNQPNNEDFENRLWEHIRQLDKNRPVFLEDESRSIGKVSLPEPFFRLMQMVPMVLIEMNLPSRIERIVNEYGGFGKEQLILNVKSISNHLGSEACMTAINMIQDDDLAGAAGLLLNYYDKKYLQAIAKTSGRSVTVIPCTGGDVKKVVRIILDSVIQNQQLNESHIS